MDVPPVVAQVSAVAVNVPAFVTGAPPVAFAQFFAQLPPIAAKVPAVVAHVPPVPANVAPIVTELMAEPGMA